MRGTKRTLIVGIVLVAAYLLTTPLLIGLREWDGVRAGGCAPSGEYLAALGSGCDCPVFTDSGCGSHPAIPLTR